MGDPLPPDPYLALGVPKDATAAAIKTQYRKLVLKFHPDKVQDESQKQAAADQFHRIQTAYEIVSDEARRARYDAQYKLQELRKDMKGGRGQSSDEDRSPRYTTEPARNYPPRERGTRVSPQYATEERRPSYAPQDYFDPQPRATSRKDSEYERATRRTPAREERTKSSKASSVGGRKKDERSSRKEKSKKSDRDVKQDRQRKNAAKTVERDASSDSDSYVRHRGSEDLRKVQQEYHEHERRQREQVEQGYFNDERTRKLFTQTSDVRDYIGRSQPERRPSPTRKASSKENLEYSRRPSPQRMSSSRDNVDYVRKTADRPGFMRRGSSKPQSAGRSSDRRAREPVFEEEPLRDSKRPPTLAHAKSSPPGVSQEARLPAEKQRSYSVQMDTDQPPIHKMRRAETTPLQRHQETVPEKSSRLRNPAYPTPETSPERQPSRQQPRAYDYGPTKAYAEDVEYESPDAYDAPAPNRYDTEERKPTRPTLSKQHRYTEEPTMARDARSRQRTTSAKQSAQPPPLSRGASTQYVYRDGQTEVRPAPSRENSSRLYGEVPTTRSPGVGRSRYPPPDEPSYTRNFSSDVNMQSGFRTKDRPSMPQRRDTRQAVR